MRHQEEVAKPPFMERTGWSGMGPVLMRKNALRNTSAILTTPSAPLRWLRIFFLMSQPPLLFQEGSGAARFNHACIDRSGAKTADRDFQGSPHRRRHSRWFGAPQSDPSS